MRKVISLLLAFFFSYNFGFSQTKEKWEILFDGKTLNGWRQVKKDSLPEHAWSVENGILVFDPARGHGGDIVTKEMFQNFELDLDYNISVGGNSGIKYFLLPNTSLGCEYQIIDDERHPDASQGINGNRKTAALYDVLPASPDKPLLPATKWNSVRIIANGNLVEHWLNGVKVLSYERGSELFKNAIATSKFKNVPGFSDAVISPILLQAHGDKVSFKDIKIKKL